jgi:hypothetical protein
MTVSNPAPSNAKLRSIRGIQPSMIDHPDFSVVVKRRGPPANPWRWEIYRAGRNSAIECSEIFFASMTEASRAGKAALNVMLSEYPD